MLKNFPMIAAAFVISLLPCLVSFQSAYADSGNQLFPRTRYDYGPSTIQVGSTLQIWWCGGDTDTRTTDNIYYRQIDVASQTYGPIISVLKPTPGTWDQAFVCDPTVIRGDWQYPPNSGNHYSYYMSYTGTANASGTSNGMGVAYSNDGINWVKYPGSIFSSTTGSSTYGVGQSSIYSIDGASQMYMFINQSPDPTTGSGRYSLYYSADGLHLQQRFKLTTNGVIPPAGSTVGFFSEADFGYDYNAGNIYMCTGRVNDLSSIDVYRIPFSQLQSGTWSRIYSFGSAQTGNSVNKGCGFMRNQYGNVTPFLPTVQVFFGSGQGTGQAGDPQIDTWDLWWRQFSVP